MILPANGRRPIVVFLHPSDELYGSDRVLLDLLRAVRAIVEPLVVLPSDGGPGPLSAALARDGIRYSHLDLPVVRRRYLSLRGAVQHAITWATGWRQLDRLVKEVSPVAIHTNTMALLIGAHYSAVHHIPHLWHLHEIANPVYAAVVARLARYSRSRVFAVSNAVRVAFEAAGGPVHAVIYNAAPAATYPLFPDSPRVTMIGRVNGWKGHEEFVKAAVILHSAGVKAQFRLIGGGVQGRPGPVNSLVRLVNGIDSDGTWLTYAGHSDSVEAEIASSTLIAVPSQRPEPLNIVALEAMAQARPVVASNIGGLPEVVVHRSTGLLVEPRSVSTLAAAIGELLNNPAAANEMGRAGQRRSRERFSSHRFSETWQTEFVRLVGHSA